MASRRTPPIPPRVFAPTVSHPMADDFTLRALRHQAKQAPGTMPVFPLPARQHPLWSGNNELGRETAFAPDANNRQLILKMQEWGEPMVWTVMLGLEYTPINLPGTGFWNVTAEVSAGVGGSTQDFEVDWLEGTTFSCPMNALTVTAKFTQIAGTTLEVPPDLRLRATVARKPLSNASPPTKSFITDVIPDTIGISDPIPIPKFARRLTPVESFGLSAPYAATTGYNWQSNPSAPSTIGGFSGDQFLAGFGSNGIPIPIAARALIVSNTAGIDTRIGLIFHLAL